ncbi:hypothetical protein PoB_004348400 [Plakobranchus ocellatus]|uniref:Uncharacterized protein n=1 Tax=Plakobranchus ocellatus TaxID=259542 RepID=A0AAV4BF43_9GAST|nr:hypothetical protein PoB_004348400 [Plakobranchus ocellatus]
MERVIIPISSSMPASSQPEEQPSTRSQRKLALFQRPKVEEPTDLKWTILELPQISKLLDELRCNACPSDEGLVLEMPSWYELAVQMNVVCRACNTILSSHFISSQNPRAQHRPRPFVTHEAVVMAISNVSNGTIFIQQFLQVFRNARTVPKDIQQVCQKIYSQNEQLRDWIFREAAALIRQEHMRQFYLNLYDDMCHSRVDWPHY